VVAFGSRVEVVGCAVGSRVDVGGISAGVGAVLASRLVDVKACDAARDFAVAGGK